MTTDEFIAQNRAKLELIVKENKPLFYAVSSTVALRSRRVFLQGLNSNGSAIGTYKGGSIYVSGKVAQKTKLPKFTLKGKGGETKFKNGKNHKSGYFESYVSFKKVEGRQQGVQTVDLFLSGELHRDWANGDMAKPMAKKLSANSYVERLNSESSDKISRYKNVFTISPEERASFYKVIQTELVKALR